MIATLYDIHGNLAALEAVLAEVPGDATIVVGGDVCFAGPEPAATLERLRSLGDRVVWVRGNTDRELKPTDATGSRLTEEQLAFLHDLPPTAQIGRTLGPLHRGDQRRLGGDRTRHRQASAGGQGWVVGCGSAPGGWT